MTKLSPRLAVMLTVPPLMWAGNAIAGRIMVPYVPPLLLNSLRWWLAMAVLAVLGRRAVATAAQRRSILRRWPYFLAVGLFGTGAYNALQYMALVTSTPINVTLIGAGMPVWMLIVGAIGFGERPRARQLVAAVCSVAGVLTVLSRGQPASLGQVHFVPGDLLMLAATACFAVYSWLLARPPASMQGDQALRVQTPEGSRAWTWSEHLLVQTVFGLVWSTGAAAMEYGITGRTIVWHPSVFAALAFVVLGASVLAYGVWGIGVAEGGPQLAAFFANLTPLFAALMSTLMLGDAPHLYHGVAFLLILGGIGLSAKR